MATTRAARLRNVILGSVALIGAGVVVSVLLVNRYFARQQCLVDGAVDDVCLARNALRAKMGAPVYSQYDEELLVRDFFEDMRDGFFVDIGAGNWRDMNMTLFLEERRGWHGIAVDANPSFARAYEENRHGTKFFAFFVGDKI